MVSLLSEMIKPISGRLILIIFSDFPAVLGLGLAESTPPLPGAAPTPDWVSQCIVFLLHIINITGEQSVHNLAVFRNPG